MMPFAMAARRNSVLPVPGPAKNWLRGRGPRQTTIGLGSDHFVTVITSVEGTGAVSDLVGQLMNLSLI
jgi:hypothetical protein